MKEKDSLKTFFLAYDLTSTNNVGSVEGSLLGWLLGEVGCTHLE